MSSGATGSDHRRWRLPLTAPSWLPGRVWAWALLAFILLPAGLLSRNGIAFIVFPPLALLALILPAPPGQPRFALDRGLLWPLLAFFLWGLITILWTTAPDFALRRWPGSLALLLLTLVSYGAARTATDDERRTVGRALTLGFALGAAILASELVTGSALYLLRYPDEGLTTSRALTQSSAQLVMLGFASFALGGWLGKPWRYLPAIAVLVLSWLFSHVAGFLGMAAALAVWAAASLWPQFTRRAWPVLLVAVLLLWPFVGLVLEATTERDASWKPAGFQAREQMWRVGAERALEKPVFGWGFSASRNIPDGDEVPMRNSERILSPHPHNIPLLLWLELGIPGVLLAGWLLLRLTQRLHSPQAQAFLTYALVLAMVTAALWPSTWLARSCCGIVLLALLCPGKGPEADRDRPGRRG